MVTINQQAFLFLTCVQTGIMMGMFYDLIRIFRKIINHPNWLVQVEDLLYWITCGGFAFTIIYWENYGQIRSFVFLGIVIGISLYFSTVSILFMKIATKVIKVMKKVMNQIIHFVLIPIKCIIAMIRVPVVYVLDGYKAMGRRRVLKKQKSRVKWRRWRSRLRTQLNIIKVKK